MNRNSDIRFSEETLEKVRILISRYPPGRQKSALLPVLHLAQAEFDGWLSPEVMDYVAELLQITPIEVYEVATFYSMYNLSPTGKHLLEVCQTGPCWLRGAYDLIQHIEKRLGIKPGETTSDGLFSLKTVECLGSCGTAPMMQCGQDYLENLTEEKLDELLEQLKGKAMRSSYLHTNNLIA